MDTTYYQFSGRKVWIVVHPIGIFRDGGPLFTVSLATPKGARYWTGSEWGRTSREATFATRGEVDAFLARFPRLTVAR